MRRRIMLAFLLLLLPLLRSAASPVRCWMFGVRRSLLLLLLPLLLLTACDTIYYPDGKVMARFSSDRQNFSFTGPGIICHADTALLSPIVKAHWHGASMVVTEVAGAAIGFGGRPAALTAATSIIAGTQTVNRPTSRPVTPQALTAH